MRVDMCNLGEILELEAIKSESVRNIKSIMTKLKMSFKEAIAFLEIPEDEEKEIPRQLAEANRKLLVETVKMCYAKINENKADLEVLDKWIEATRIKLKKNLLIKHDKESMNEQLYSGMHNIFGPEIMGVLDDINSKGQE